MAESTPFPQIHQKNDSMVTDALESALSNTNLNPIMEEEKISPKRSGKKPPRNGGNRASSTHKREVRGRSTQSSRRDVSAIS